MNFMRSGKPSHDTCKKLFFCIRFYTFCANPPALFARCYCFLYVSIRSVQTLKQFLQDAVVFYTFLYVLCKQSPYFKQMSVYFIRFYTFRVNSLANLQKSNSFLYVSIRSRKIPLRFLEHF